MHKKDRETTKERAYEIIDNALFGTLAVSHENKPYAVPLNFVREGNNLYFHSAKVGLKVKMLKENDDVSVSFVDYSELNPPKLTTNYSSAIVIGKAMAVSSKEEKVAALKAICNKFAPISESVIDKAIANNISVTAIYKIEIISVTGKENRKR